MKTSLRLGVFLFLGGMAIVISLTGWVLFSTQAKLAVVSGQPLAGWLLPVYLLAALFIAAIFAVGFSKWNRVSDRAVIEKTQELVQTELHRLSAGLSKLSEGDLTVQLDMQTNPLDDTWYPGLQPQVRLYNHLLQEIHQIYQKFNQVTDEPCQRLVYVGADSFMEGRTCAELMGQVLQGQGNVAIITTVQTHAMEIRRAGFRSFLSENVPGIRVVEFLDCQGQLDNVYSMVMDLLKRNPDIAGIYVTNGSTPHLVVRALVDAGKAGKIKMVCHDLVDSTMQAMEQGVVTTTISQDPFAQGHDPVIYLYNYLVAGEAPPRAKMTTHMDRITSDNLHEFWDPEHGAIENEVTLERRARPVEALSNRELRILFLGREDIAFYGPVKRGVLSAAEELKVRNTQVTWLEPESARDGHRYSAEDYGPEIERAIAEKWDAIAVPVYDKALVPYINRAVAAGIPVATLNSEPSSLRNLINHLINQSENLREISIHLAESAALSEVHANQISDSIGVISQALMSEVQSAVEAIQHTDDIAQSMTLINDGAKDQEKALNSVLEAIDGISYAVSSTNFTVLTSEETADQAVVIAQEGATVIHETLSQIQSISEAVSASVSQIHELNNILKQIDSIVGTVNDFTEQTNLLALNAAIEAAHAGEYGAGFTVVGSEIRDLAVKSKASTRKIALLIHEIQKSSKKMVSMVDNAMLQVQSGSQLAAQAGNALNDLMKSAELMKTQMENVMLANARAIDSLDYLNVANEQVSTVVGKNVAATAQATSGIQRAVDMINQMTGISIENSKSIEGIDASAEDVVTRAQHLKEAILTLVTMSEELRSSAASFKTQEIQ